MMNWLKINVGLLIIGGMLMAVACKDRANEPLENDPTPPGKVHDVSVVNEPGAAKIKYTLPKDQDLLYVKAVYDFTNGKQSVVKSSYYNNSLEVQGFADTLQHEVKLYAVNRSEVASDPVKVTVHPKESPIWDIYRSLSAQADFGGVRIEAENPERANVAIQIMEKNDLGEWEVDPNSIHTSTEDISYALRGLDTLKHKFAFSVRDQWLNHTDTLFTTIKPFYETVIPKSGYTGVRLPGDAPAHKTSISGMWDGDIINWPNIYMTEGTYNKPAIVTFDLGEMAKLSRIVIWDYPEYYNGRTYYYQAAMKRFEVWGTDDPPSDGSFRNWHKLGTFEEKKPSGLSYGQQNDEDYQAANSGFSWSLDINAAKVRYVRIKCLENWGGSENLAIAEIQVYGDPR